MLLIVDSVSGSVDSVINDINSHHLLLHDQHCKRQLWLQFSGHIVTPKLAIIVTNGIIAKHLHTNNKNKQSASANTCATLQNHYDRLAWSAVAMVKVQQSFGLDLVELLTYDLSSY